MKKAILLFMLVTSTAFAQKTINNYKYIIVPKQFEFFNEVDKYQTSSLTQFLFKKAKFNAVKSDEQFPMDLAENRCLALTTNLIEESTMFGTKIVIQLKDCNNNIVYTSQKGKSKLKDYKKAYHDAIRKAFKSIERLNYRYVQANSAIAMVKSIKDKKLVEKPVSVSTQIPSKKIAIRTEPLKKNREVLPTKKISNNVHQVPILYAQANGNGYQLVNTKPAVVFQILPLSTKNFYIIKDKNGIFYNNKGTWIAEYYQNGTKVIEQYNVKF